MESGAVHDKRVAVPLANRVPQPRRFAVARLWEGPPVREHLAKHHADVGFVQERRQLRRLQNLERAADVDPRHAEWQAVAVGIVDVIAIPPLLPNGGRPRRHFDVPRLEAPCQIVEIQHIPHIPDA